MSDITSTFLKSELSYRSDRIKSGFGRHDGRPGGRTRRTRRPTRVDDATTGSTSAR